VVITICWLSFMGNKQFLNRPKWQNGLLKNKKVISFNTQSAKTHDQ
jgi:hypothetical protein